MRHKKWIFGDFYIKITAIMISTIKNFQSHQQHKSNFFPKDVEIKKQCFTCLIKLSKRRPSTIIIITMPHNHRKRQKERISIANATRFYDANHARKRFSWNAQNREPNEALYFYYYLNGPKASTSLRADSITFFFFFLPFAGSASRWNRNKNVNLFLLLSRKIESILARKVRCHFFPFLCFPTNNKPQFSLSRHFQNSRRIFATTKFFQT